MPHTFPILLHIQFCLYDLHHFLGRRLEQYWAGMSPVRKSEVKPSHTRTFWRQIEDEWQQFELFVQRNQRVPFLPTNRTLRFSIRDQLVVP